MSAEDNTVQVLLQKGLQPTFAGPRNEYTLILDGTTDEATLRYAKFDPSTLPPKVVAESERTLKGEELTSFLDKVKELQDLPSQPPSVTHDAYGHDVAVISRFPGGRVWRNGPAQGCAVPYDEDDDDEGAGAQSAQASFSLESHQMDRFKAITDSLHQTAQELLPNLE
ncbi:hypothetical protein IWQ60_007517 [Tieghemiomyces parasiticus]|uniref:Uncharacterized protein n=1 Tax=Tieghemiomyces parasiticus TaxID=78921 RepID=A0A9W7ZWY1_9FUNG|nr:hypothetical protein IWQ60_007517 [Tieghemiomyces parasiticus]